MAWLRGLVVTSVVAAGVFGVTSHASAVPVGDEAALQAAVADVSETSITLTADINLTCGGGGALVRNSATPLTIVGAGHYITQTCIGVDVIDVVGTGGLTFSGVALSGGENTIVSNDAPITLIGSLIIGGNGYGIDTATGPVDVAQSYIFNGHLAGIHSSSAAVTVTDAGMGSGGSAIISDGDVTLVRSNVTNAGLDGVVVNGTTRIVNSTILWSRGSGVVAGGPTTLVYSSVALSSAFGNDGVNLAFGGPSGSYELQNTLIARQASMFGQPIPSATPANCAAGQITSLGYNLADDTSCLLNAPTDRPEGVDPLVGLAAVPPGSLFAALIPQSGSPLIDAIPTTECQAGEAAGITTDEFGSPRPGPAGRCDIGAYQTQGTSEPPTTDPTTPEAVVVAPRFTG